MISIADGRSLRSTEFVLLLFGIVGGIPVVVHYLAAGPLGMGLSYDAGQVWLPIARQIAEGKVLYVTTRPDNKTPLFHGLNYLVYRTGHYALVFHLLVALANITVAFLLRVWLGRHGMRRAGVFAGFLFLAAIPLINGDIINVRSFALVFLLLAVLDKDPVERGVLTAIGVLFSQFVVFALPVLLYDGLRSSDAPRNWTTRFVTSGLGTGVLCFASLFLLWGPTAVVRGINMTFLSITEYAVAHQDNYNPFLHPFLWLKNLVRVTTTLLFVLVPAGFTVLEVTLTDRERRWDPFGLSVLLSGAFLLTLLIKSLPYYWMFPTAFLAVVSAIGTARWADQSSSKTVLETDLPSNHE